MKKSRESLLYLALHPIAILLFALIFWPRVKGLKNVPKHGSAVLAGNHRRSMDCFMVMLGSMRCIHFLAKAELFKGPFNGFFTAAGLIPVHRKTKDPAALTDAVDYLNNGRLIGIFPEGTVNRTKDVMMPLKIGAVKMASDTDSPIVPFTITGRYIPFVGNLKIVFHEPIKITGDDLQKENEALRAKLADALTKQRSETRA